MQIGQSHPTGLTSKLLKLFEPWLPLEFKPPLEKRKCPSLTGVTLLSRACLNGFRFDTNLYIMKTQIFLETPTRHCSCVDLQVILSFVFWIFQLVANILFGDDLFYFPLTELWTYETTESRLKRELESYGPIKQVGILSISQEGLVRGYVTTCFL
jgi:U1 small nuclear ribonucleoprotein